VVGQTSTLVANSAQASETRDDPFAGGPNLPRLRLGNSRGEFATSVDIPVCPASAGKNACPTTENRLGDSYSEAI
jgi:hypothetical protein